VKLRRLLPLLLLAGAPAFAHDGAACSTSPSSSVVSAREGLAKNPQSLDALFRLADALVESTCYDAAVHELEDGEEAHPRSPELQAKLRTTRSLVSEESYFAGLEQAEVAARVSRNLLRCSKLGDLNACDEALKLKPNDVDILTAKGDAQLAAGKPADAEQTYSRARQFGPDNAKVAAQLMTAQAQRAAALSTCQKGADDAALAACQAALLRGADDEFTVNTRLAQLYQQRNQPASALAAYIAANTLKRGDRNVALGIVALTESGAHRDAVAWAARGAALLTLKRGTEARAALKQALALAPAMPDLRSEIAQAEAIARTETKTPPPDRGAESPTRVAETVAPPAKKYSNEAAASRSD
jgi:tetratricopeptide (TPR) repeat protein